MVVPIVLTVGEYAFAKAGGLVARLKTVSTLGRTEEVANLLIDAEKAGKTIVSEAERIVIKEGDDIVTTIEKKADEVVVKNIEKITTTAELKEFLTTIDETTTIAQLEEKGIKSFFRGTTRNKVDNSLFPGNPNSQAFGISTSTDPIKATIFAIESATEFGSTKGVLQIGLPSDLKSIKLNSPNIYRCEKELEIVIQTPADNFASLSKVEISVEDARKLVKEVYGIELDTRIYRDVSDELLETLPASTLEQSFEFYQKALKYNLK